MGSSTGTATLVRSTAGQQRGIALTGRFDLHPYGKGNQQPSLRLGLQRKRPFPDGQVPDNKGLILPRAHQPKVDIANVLGVVLDALGAPNNLSPDPAVAADPTKWVLALRTEGTFHQSELRDAAYQNRMCVIMIGRPGQSTERMGLGGMVGAFPASAMVDPIMGAGTTPIVPVGASLVKGKLKTTTVDLQIFSTNSQNADNIAALIGELMDNVVEDALIEQLGYFECIETSGGDGSVSVVTPTGGQAFFCYERTLTYAAKWMSHIVSEDIAARLVRQTFFTDRPHNADGDAHLTADLFGGP